jgi:hypothetical protein
MISIIKKAALGSVCTRAYRNSHRRGADYLSTQAFFDLRSCVFVTSRYELTIEKRPLYLYVCVQGTVVDRTVAPQYMGEILEEFRTAQYSRMLIKKEIPAALKAEDLDHIADEIVRQGYQGLKIAIVDEWFDDQAADHRGANSAQQAGLDVAFFNSFAPAVHWLLHG